MKLTYLFEVMQGVTAIHSRMSGNLKQLCSLVWVHLNLLVVFFPSLADVHSKIHDLVKMKEFELIHLFEPAVYQLIQESALSKY